MEKGTGSERFAVKPSHNMSRFPDWPLFHILLVAVLGIVAYSNTFAVPFQFDDYILNSRRLRDISYIPSLFTDIRDYFGTRPLLLATLTLNYHFGGVNTLGFHTVNLILHLLNSALLYLLVMMTGRHLGYGEKVVRSAALFSAGLFVLHPAQTEAVTNIIGRSVLLATFFYLSGLILFLKAATAVRRKGLFIAGLFAVSLLGMASRESFATFPVVLVLYDLFFVSRFRLGEAMKHYKAHSAAFLSLAYLGYLLLRNTYETGTEFPGVGVPHKDYFLTQFNVHWTYLRLLILPINQNIDYDYPIARTLLEFPTILSFIGYLGLWAGVIVLARRRPVVSFSALWFLVALLPISFGVTFMDLRLDDVIFEHRLYLPSAGIFAAAGSWISFRLENIGKGKASVVAACVASILALALLSGTYARNAVWQSAVSLWEDTVMKSPGKSRPHNNLGIAYNRLGQTDMAYEELRIALELEPDDFKTHYNLGIVYENRGLPEKAIEHYRTAIRLMPNYVAAHNNLGSVLGDLGRLDEAVEHFQAALRFNPEDSVAHSNLGMAYRMMGLEDKAEEHFRIAESLSRGKAAMDPEGSDVFPPVELK